MRSGWTRRRRHGTVLRREGQHLVGNQIRSYVFQPYRMVKDLRTGVETSNVQAVMDGNLDAFVNGWLRAGCPIKRMQGVKDEEE